jgi:transcriptional regulator with XRE-family HTH domain
VGVSESFGRRLRAERERQGISLASIAARSKISVSLLEGLERNDVSRWPVGIYRRSFMRFYANAVGMDAESVVREFLSLYPDPADPAVTAPQDEPGAPPPPGLRLTLAADSGWAPLAMGFPFRRRWAAVAFDSGTVLILAVALFMISGQFWLPLAISAMCYQLAGILMLGNTPGMFFFGTPAAPPRPQPERVERRRSSRTAWAIEPPVSSGINQERGMQRT